MNPSPNLLRVKDLSVSLGDRKVLDNFEMELPKGEIVALLGQSGSGKTSLLRAIAGLQLAESGEVHLDDECLFCGCDCYIPTKAREIGMVFQDYALFPHMTVAENIVFGVPKLSKSAKQQKVQSLLALVQLPEDFAKKYPHELSGGQQQRVALARTLAPNPRLILLDEPFSSLDSQTRYKLVEDMKKVFKEQGVSAILVTHDQKEADLLADKVGYLSNGTVEQWHAIQ